jgi:hypothetical protein
MTMRWLGRGTRRRFFLMLLTSYSVFYLSGTKSPPIPTPHYSYTLRAEGGAVGWDPIALWRQSSLADILIPSAYRYDTNRYRGIASSKATGLAAMAGASSPPPMPRMMAYLTTTTRDS